MRARLYTVEEMYILKLSCSFKKDVFTGLLFIFDVFIFIMILFIYEFSILRHVALQSAIVIGSRWCVSNFSWAGLVRVIL